VPPVRENALVGLDAETLAAGARTLILNKRLERLVRLHAQLLLQIFDVLIEVLLTVSLLQRHDVLLHSELLQVSLDVVDRLLVLSQLNLLLTVVVAEVASVEDVVFERVEMISQRLNVMRPDEPFLLVFVR